MRNIKKWFLFVTAFLLLGNTAAAYDRNFAPIETVTLTAGTSTTSVQFTLAQSAISQELLVTNTGTTTAFVSCSTGSAVTASVPGDTVSWPVMANGAILVNKGAATWCAGITASGSDVLYLTSGAGN